MVGLKINFITRYCDNLEVFPSVLSHSMIINYPILKTDNVSLCKFWCMSSGVPIPGF